MVRASARVGHKGEGEAGSGSAISLTTPVASSSVSIGCAICCGGCGSSDSSRSR